jgi:hypothetical protein
MCTCASKVKFSTRSSDDQQTISSPLVQKGPGSAKLPSVSNPVPLNEQEVVRQPLITIAVVLEVDEHDLVMTEPISALPPFFIE